MRASTLLLCAGILAACTGTGGRTETQGVLGLIPGRPSMEAGAPVGLFAISRETPSAGEMAGRLVAMAELVTGDTGFEDGAAAWATEPVRVAGRDHRRPFARHPEVLVIGSTRSGRLDVRNTSRNRTPPGVDLAAHEGGIGPTAAYKAMASVYGRLVETGAIDGAEYSHRLATSDADIAFSSGLKGAPGWSEEYVFTMRPYRNSIPVLDGRLRIGISWRGDPSSVAYRNVTIVDAGTVTALVSEQEAEREFRQRALHSADPRQAEPAVSVTSNGVVYTLGPEEPSGTVGPHYYGWYQLTFLGDPVARWSRASVSLVDPWPPPRSRVVPKPELRWPHAPGYLSRHPARTRGPLPNPPKPPAAQPN